VTPYKMVGDHPEDLADGRVLGPGEVAELSEEDLEDPHNQRLVDEGLLIEADEGEEPKPKTSRAKTTRKESE
jgi:hypothetical protein